VNNSPNAVSVASSSISRAKEPRACSVPSKPGFLTMISMRLCIRIHSTGTLPVVTVPGSVGLGMKTSFLMHS
jgi:hypothetical protein